MPGLTTRPINRDYDLFFRDRDETFVRLETETSPSRDHPWRWSYCFVYWVWDISHQFNLQLPLSTTQYEWERERVSCDLDTITDLSDIFSFVSDRVQWHLSVSTSWRWSESWCQLPQMLIQCKVKQCWTLLAHENNLALRFFTYI